ncbi:MAG TPA: hypothetical protein VGL19_02765 [Polyangiaceae bacterium]
MNVAIAQLMSLALVGCAAATPPARASRSERHAPALATTTSAGTSDAATAAQNVRLGPPSPRGLGLRRVDRAARASTTLALEHY